MDYQQIQPDRFKEMLELAAYAFDLEPDEEFQKVLHSFALHSAVYGAIDQDHLTSQLLVLQMSIFLHETEIPMGGVSYVSSYPEVRGSGNITELIGRALKGMKEKGQLLSFLSPFSYAFYRKYGYEHVFNQTTYTIANKDLPHFKEVKGTVKRVKGTQVLSQLADLYQKRYQQALGPVVRREWNWELKLEQHKHQQVALYLDEDNQAQGYLLYHFSKSQKSTFVLDEMVYLTHDAFKGLWQFITSHRSSFAAFSYVANDGEKLADLFENPRIQQKTQPHMMARIVDFPAFIQTYPFLERAQATFYLKVKDDFAEWNNGLWKVELRTTGRKVTKVQEEEKVPAHHWIEGTIQDWTCFLLHSQDIKKMAFHERILADKAVLQDFVERVPNGHPELYDAF